MNRIEEPIFSGFESFTLSSGTNRRYSRYSQEPCYAITLNSWYLDNPFTIAFGSYMNQACRFCDVIANSINNGVTKLHRALAYDFFLWLRQASPHLQCERLRIGGQIFASHNTQWRSGVRI